MVIFCRFLRAWGKQKIPIPLGKQDFTVFCFSSKWCHQESNRGHKDFQSFALPSELWHLGFACAKIELFFIILLIFCHKNENDRDFDKKNAKIWGIIFAFLKLYVSLSPQNKVRGVAQLVSAPRSGRGGRTFESSHPDLQSQSLEIEAVAIVV